MTELYKKLAKVRDYNTRITKSKDNPFFKSKYADLNSVIEVTDEILEEVGLIYLDFIRDNKLISAIIDPDTGKEIVSETPLLLVKQDMQQLGGAITYARRFARMAMFGLQAVDDDGSAASGQKFITPKQIKEITNLLLETQTEADAFLKHYRVEAVKDMLEPAAANAIATLKIKKKKMEEAKDV